MFVSNNKSSSDRNIEHLFSSGQYEVKVDDESALGLYEHIFQFNSILMVIYSSITESILSRIADIHRRSMGPHVIVFAHGYQGIDFFFSFKQYYSIREGNRHELMEFYLD